MKKLSIITAFVAILCFGMTKAMAQNTNPAIAQFVEQYFPKATVQMVMPDDDDIDVVLNDYTKIEFRLNNEWKKVDCSRANHCLRDRQFPERHHQKAGKEFQKLGD